MRPPDVQITPAIPVMGMPGFAPAGSGTERHIELSTPPPEEGAAEFDPSSTGLIRTDTFEIPTETGQRASSLQIDQTAYQGVVPGQRDELPTFERFTRARAPYVTWVGFQPVGNGRVFVQLTRQAAFNLTQLRGDEYRLEIQGAHLAFSNVQRHMDTSFFPGNLALVRAERRGRNVQITLKLKKAGHPTVQQSGDYLYVTIP